MNERIAKKSREIIIGLSLSPKGSVDYRFTYIPVGTKLGWFKKTKEPLWKTYHLGQYLTYLTRDELSRWMSSGCFVGVDNVVYFKPSVTIYYSGYDFLSKNTETKFFDTESEAIEYFEELKKENNLYE